MFNILCYGDSNTFGCDPFTGARFDKDNRWPGIVQKTLGGEYNVIEEGLPGRTTVWNDPVMNLISGADYLFPCLCSHQPLDLVILMLGTNDLKKMFSASPYDAHWGMERVMRIIDDFKTELSERKLKMFLVSPPHICEPVGRFAQMFEDAPDKSTKLAPYYADLAAKYSALFLDAATIVQVSKHDGLHLDAQNHKKLGLSIAKKVEEYFVRERAGQSQ